MRISLEKIDYLLLIFVVLLCALRAVTLYYWWNLPDIEMHSSPAIYEGVKYPVVSLAAVVVGLLSMAILLIPKFRTISHVFFLSGVLVAFGIASIVSTWYLSFNVSGGGALFLLLGLQIYRKAKDQLVTISGVR